jgi:hypothetical protein
MNLSKVQIAMESAESENRLVVKKPMEVKRFSMAWIRGC